jgi:hypothetical protein
VLVQGLTLRPFARRFGPKGEAAPEPT